MSSYKKVCEVISKTCLDIKKGENVVIVTDINKQKIGNELFNYLQKITNTVMIQIPITSKNGEEPVAIVNNIFQKADVIIAPTTMSLSHTRAFVNARKKGTRVASLPGITENMFLQSIDVDYSAMSELTKKLADAIKGKNIIKVKTDLGTDISFSVKGRKPICLDGICHKKGGFINLPDGEMCIAPIENSMNGVLVFDLSSSPDHRTKWGKVGLLNNEKIKLVIKNGKIISFSNGAKAKIIKNIIDNSDKNANCIAEFAIGTNNKARITGLILEDEKKLGTIHFAFGSNVSIGGKNQSNLHLDMIMDKPDVFFDNVQILKKGKLLI